MSNSKFIVIDGIKTDYIITDDGNVFSLKSQQYLSKFIAGKGYYYVHLTVNGKKQNVAIHRLVAIAFIPNPNNKPTVNHKNCTKLNNYYTNLEWATYSEQNKHMHYMKKLGKTQEYKKKQKNINISDEKNILQIIRILKETNLSCNKIGGMFNMTQQSVYDIYSKKTWKHLTYDVDFINRSKYHNYTNYKKDIYKLLYDNPSLSCKTILIQLKLNPSPKLKNFIHNIRREVKIDKSSTTIERDPNKYYININ